MLTSDGWGDESMLWVKRMEGERGDEVGSRIRMRPPFDAIASWELLETFSSERRVYIYKVLLVLESDFAEALNSGFAIRCQVGGNCGARRVGKGGVYAAIAGYY
jgi:hypothetical protein